MANQRASPFDLAFLTNNPNAGELLLVRHGQQVWPDPNNSVTSDWVDPPLSELGIAQAKAVAEHLSADPVDAAYSSHLTRANHTGAAIAKHHNLEVEVRADLEEIHLFRDLPQNEAAVDTIGESGMEAIREQFASTRNWSAYPFTEPAADFRNRITRSIEAILASSPGQRIVVACHGGVINAYLADLLGIDTDMFFRPVHASVHRVRFLGPRRVVATLNEQHFLAGANLLSV